MILTRRCHVGKWNFDEIFRGTEEEQTNNCACFADGCQRLGEDYDKKLALAVLSDEPGEVERALNRINDLCEALLTFKSDPRVVDLSRKVNARRARDFAERLGNEIVKTVLGDRPVKQ